MITAVGIVQVFVMILVNTAITALMTRFFRVRLDTSWGPILFALLLIPAVLVVFTQAMSAIGLGFDMGSPGIVLVVFVVAPLALGLTFDYFWMPAPEDVELPDKYRTN